MDKYTEETRFSDYSSYDTYEQKPAMDYSLENELRKTIQRQKRTIFRLAERNKLWKIISAVLAILLVIESVVLWANSDDDGAHIPEVSQVQTEDGDSTIDIQAVAPNAVDEGRIDEMLSQMTLIDKIHQMMFVSPEELTGVDAATVAGESTKSVLFDRKVGGIIY